MKGREFALTVFKVKGDQMGISFSEKQIERAEESRRGSIKESRIWGTPLKAITETLLGTLKRQGYRPMELSLKRKESFLLDEPAGVRLGLFFFSLKPLRKVGRMEEIISGIDRMSDEEAYYWYAKCTNGRNAQQARKALRVLLSGE